MWSLHSLRLHIDFELHRLQLIIKVLDSVLYYLLQVVNFVEILRIAEGCNVGCRAAVPGSIYFAPSSSSPGSDYHIICRLYVWRGLFRNVAN